jgi:Domain of unknown function (DUF4062)
MARIYISSTYSDLQESREAVYRVLRKMGHDAIAMEDYVATDQRPLDKCLADVARCDIYIGIFAWRYGYIPPNQEQSITELEFREAVRRGKHCLLFQLHEDAPWPHSRIDRDTSRIETLRAELSRDYMMTFFKTSDELATSVSIAVGEALKQIPLENGPLLRLEHARAQEVHYHYDYIPLSPVDADTLAEAEQLLAEMPLDDVPDTAPLPQGSVAPLRKNPLFKGREAAFQALAKVLKADDADLEGQTPPVIVTGIGGIGKSQLASEFVHRYGQYFLGGVFWLSFAVPSAVAAEVANCGEPGNMDLWAPNFDDLHPDELQRQELKVR